VYIYRCELCEKSCTLTTPDSSGIRFCPANHERAAWKQINRRPET